MVLIIQPGMSSESFQKHEATTPQPSSIQTTVQFMDLFRNLIPDNIFHAMLSSEKTVIHPDFQNYSIDVEIDDVFTHSKTRAGTPNILGLVIHDSP